MPSCYSNVLKTDCLDFERESYRRAVRVIPNYKRNVRRDGERRKESEREMIGSFGILNLPPPVPCQSGFFFNFNSPTIFRSCSDGRMTDGIGCFVFLLEMVIRPAISRLDGKACNTPHMRNSYYHRCTHPPLVKKS